MKQRTPTDTTDLLARATPIPTESEEATERIRIGTETAFRTVMAEHRAIVKASIIRVAIWVAVLLFVPAAIYGLAGGLHSAWIRAVNAP